MENGPLEDVFPIENGDIPASYVSLPEGNFIHFKQPVAWHLLDQVSQEPMAPVEVRKRPWEEPTVSRRGKLRQSSMVEEWWVLGKQILCYLTAIGHLRTLEAYRYGSFCSINLCCSHWFSCIPERFLPFWGRILLVLIDVITRILL